MSWTKPVGLLGGSLCKAGGFGGRLRFYVFLFFAMLPGRARSQLNLDPFRVSGQGASSHGQILLAQVLPVVIPSAWQLVQTLPRRKTAPWWALLLSGLGFGVIFALLPPVSNIGEPLRSEEGGLPPPSNEPQGLDINPLFM